ncbi:MAG: methylated-DNA--[protein]-cysteine S-methyltransferase [Fimbriimonadales bacterium]|nr:methylated-DNA--[protein]-cysteine S-methyltransferase [Fimbriimonadales bacterium]
MEGSAEFQRFTAHTRIGDVELVASPAGLCAVLLPGTRRRPPWLAATRAAGSDPGLHEAALQLNSFLQGFSRNFRLSLDLRGTEFQIRVWRWLLTLPYGSTSTYAQGAVAIGRSASDARAVARAVAANPLPIVVPCHRVLAKEGSLAGYVGGIALKRTLLDLEAGQGSLPL